MNALVARGVGIVSAAWPVISTSGSSSHRSSTDAYRHSWAYVCTTINATTINTGAIGATTISGTAISAAAINPGAMNAAVINPGATPICESVS